MTLILGLFSLLNRGKLKGADGNVEESPHSDERDAKDSAALEIAGLLGLSNQFKMVVSKDKAGINIEIRDPGNSSVVFLRKTSEVLQLDRIEPSGRAETKVFDLLRSQVSISRGFLIAGKNSGENSRLQDESVVGGQMQFARQLVRSILEI